MATVDGLVIPKVYGDLVTQKVAEKVKVATLATELGYLADTQEGASVTFPKFKFIGDAQEVVKGIVSAIESLQQTSAEAEIKHFDKVVRIYDIDNITALGNHVENAAEQMGTVFARKLDAQLIECAIKSPLQVTTATGNAITASELNKALGLFADEQDVEDFAGIVINSLLLDSFINMQEFVSSSRTDVTMGNGIISRGCVGYFRGIPVYMSNHKTYDSVKGTCVTLIIKKDALAYMPKKRATIELERESKLHATDVVANYIFATHLVNDAGVVVLKKAGV